MKISHPGEYLIRGLEGVIEGPDGKLLYFTADAASLEEEFDEDEVTYDSFVTNYVTKVNIILRLKDIDKKGFLYRLQELP